MECQLLERGFSQLRGMVTARISGRCLFVERVRERLPPYCSILLTFGCFLAFAPGYMATAIANFISLEVGNLVETP
jgi:hypothetical protein